MKFSNNIATQSYSIIDIKKATYPLTIPRNKFPIHFLFRCSEAFFAEERICLSDRRERIRILQQQKTFDLTKFLDMPNNIPLPLVIGTTVTGTVWFSSV